MNICDNFSKMIVLFLDDELSEKECDIFFDHLNKCDECRLQFFEYVDIESLLYANSPQGMLLKNLIKSDIKDNQKKIDEKNNKKCVKWFNSKKGYGITTSDDKSNKEDDAQIGPNKISNRFTTYIISESRSAGVEPADVFRRLSFMSWGLKRRRYSKSLIKKVIEEIKSDTEFKYHDNNDDTLAASGNKIRLSMQDATIFFMKLKDGLSFEQISNRLKIPIELVEERYKHAMSKWKMSEDFNKQNNDI